MIKKKAGRKSFQRNEILEGRRVTLWAMRNWNKISIEESKEAR